MGLSALFFLSEVLFVNYDSSTKKMIIITKNKIPNPIGA